MTGVSGRAGRQIPERHSTADEGQCSASGKIMKRNTLVCFVLGGAVGLVLGTIMGRRDGGPAEHATRSDLDEGGSLRRRLVSTNERADALIGELERERTIRAAGAAMRAATAARKARSDAKSGSPGQDPSSSETTQPTDLN